jgi:acyl-CoA thioester hydrolase
VIEKSSYFKIIEVQPEHLDELDHVNNVVYLQWIQDIARDHWFSQVSEDLASQVYWVVISHHIEYKMACLLGDKLTIRTTVGDDLSTVKWGRDVWVYREDQLMVEAHSVWCLMDRSTNRPKRISKKIIEVFINGAG